MALWEQIQQLPQEYYHRLRTYYEHRYPIEVRHSLAAFIETNFQINGSPDDLQYQQYVITTINGLVKELDDRVTTNAEKNWLLTQKFSEAALTFKLSNPLELYKIIRDGLTFELQLVHNKMDTNKGAEILQKMNDLFARVSEIAQDYNKMSQESDSVCDNYHKILDNNALIAHYANRGNDPENVQMRQKCEINRQLLDAAFQTTFNNFGQLKLSLSEKSKAIFQDLELMQKRIVMEELDNWKREQQLAGNGAKFDAATLDTIQDWCQSLAELIWKSRQIITKAKSIIENNELLLTQPDNILPQLQQNFSDLLKTMIKRTFVIEKQPPQVMKTSTRFPTTARLLVGVPLGVHMSPPQVTVTIISEQQALTLYQQSEIVKPFKDNSGDLINNTGTMEYQQAAKQLTVSFRNMQLKKIRRTEKKGTESVMDEKFCLLFQSHFQIGGDLFHVLTFSLPVAVIVHGNQEAHALATVTWDNAFSLPDREPFKVPDKVPWPKVAETLSVKFYSYTGKALDEDNLHFLAEKAFRGQYNENSMLTYAQFSKDPLPERNFTFWEWFYAIMKLTRDHLKGPWKDGAIMGFVKKNIAEEMLSKTCLGTFLLRFSDSELGGITIAWIGYNNDNFEVLSLQPFTAKDIGVRALPDRIADLNYLVYLYPNTPKEQIFQKYYTPYSDTSTTPSGYVKPLLVTHVPGWSNNFANAPSMPARPDSVASSYAPSMATTVPMEALDMNDMNELISNYLPQIQLMD
ncbi:unnamed protein product [Brassicogethes aeneus]|uniref:Signal transducer and activator of transcription n=1 Tax=Brassicogethes aeneus TaxID=1431903 RepID=A0A9P0FID3_BRAAE|nr:unnamed protein product [Brassicogethes aeneus]